MFSEKDLARARAEAPHGTRSRYSGGCRCAPCKKSNLDRYHRRCNERRARAHEVKPTGPPLQSTVVRAGRTYEIKRCPGANGNACVAKGGPAWLRTGGPVCVMCIERETVWDGLVPADRARQHLRALSRKGVGYKSVSAASDICHNVLCKILQDPDAKIHRSTERAILEVDASAVADGAIVDGKKTWTRIERLIEEGFTKAELARRLGYRSESIQFRDRVLAKTALKVEKFYKMIMAI